MSENIHKHYMQDKVENEHWCRESSSGWPRTQFLKISQEMADITERED